MTDDPYAPADPARHLARMPTDLATTDEANYTPEQFARFQHFMAPIGGARGQCLQCYAYRADGKAPKLHVPGSPCADQDGRPL